VVKVKLAGLKIVRARGKYYVYVRATGETLLKGFEGDKAELVKRLSKPDMLGAYNVRRKRAPKSYAEKTLGWLVAWYQDPDQCPEYKGLAPATKEDYDAALTWLEPEYDAPLETIDQGSLYEVRDRCAKEKWPAFADKVMTALSSMFGQAVKRRKMPSNPARGIERARKSDPNANREWQPAEWLTVRELAPAHLRTAYMIARHLGYRSQSIVAVTWKDFQPDPRFRMCFRMAHRKNREDQHWMPASPDLQSYLAGLKVRTKDGPIALRFNGKPWETPEQLQKQSSNFLAKLEAKGLIEAGLTLHGLRVTFAAEIKRVTGANDDQVAAALGDRDTRMGRHYTRHVEQENKVALLFFSQQMGTGTEQDLENGRVQVFQNSKNTSNVIDLKD
jgi:integrase